jgi:hypothetical protein
MDEMTTSPSAPRGRALPWVLLLVVAGGGAWLYSAKLRSKVHQQLDRVTGWDAEARRDDPVGFIDFSIARLNDNIAKFDDVRRDLALAKGKLQKLHDDNAAKLAFAGKELDAFKASYKEAKGKEASGGTAWPVAHAGRNYSEADLKSQVNLLLGQKAAYESVLKQTQDGLDTSGRREVEIVGRVTESKAKLDLLKTQRELVRINKLTADTEKLLGDVQEVLVENEALTAQNPVRTVDELMRQAEATNPQANANVDAFLNG